MLLQVGDIREEVAEVQKLLSMLGYDLVIDGHFGAKTKRSVKAFQKKVGLINDGTVDTDTYNALKLSQKRSANEITGSRPTPSYNFQIIDSYRLNPNQYIKQIYDKKQIYLHFTASGPNARGVIDYWNSNDPRIATAYVIDGSNANIYECFNPDYWSYHLGIKGTKGKIDKSSIGIEICSYGPLKKRGNEYYAWPNNYETVKVPKNKVYELQRDFRGFKYFEAFTDEQIEAAEQLLNFLIPHYDIPIQESFDYTWFDYDQDVIDRKVPGIWSHTTVRRDKYDLYPDHRIIDMLNRVAQKHYRG